MFWYNVISHNSSYYLKMCISEKTKKKIKYKENILKAAREKQQITHKGIPIRLTSDLSAETLQARRSGRIYLK